MELPGQVIDADAHVNEDVLAWKGLEAAHPGWIGAARSGDRWVAQIDGRLYPVQEGPGAGVPIERSLSPACEAGAADVGRRLADMDAEGIDVQVLFGGLAIGVCTFDDVGFAGDFARAYNEWLLGLCKHAPDRLKAVAIVALQSIDGAIAELEHARSAGAVAVTIPPVLDETRNLDDASLLAFFEAAAALDTAVCIHSAPGMNVPLPAAGRFSNYAQVHCLSFPADQMVAFTALAMGGVLDRFPALRVGFMESGIGWVPYFVHRMHEHHEKLAPMVPAMKTDPRDLLARGQCYFSFEAEEPMLAACVEHLGTSPWIYASDYPHWDSDFPGTVDECREKAGAAGLGDDDVAMLLGGNAARLYGL